MDLPTLVTLPYCILFQLVFEGIRGFYYLSDIAILYFVSACI